MKQLIIIFIFLLSTAQMLAQVKKKQVKVNRDTIFADDLINPLSPAKAAFYSAVLPGLGQAYNKKYWKIPIVYGALGTSTYFYFRNNSFYNVYRKAYKLRLAGKTDEFSGIISTDGLISAQKVFKQNRDLSMFLTLAFYALNIIEANVDAHIVDRPISNKVSFRPNIIYSSDINRPVFGLTTSIKLN